jgi:hypothetical protein
MRKVAPDTIDAESPHNFLASLGKMILISFSVGSLTFSWAHLRAWVSLPPLYRLFIVPNLLTRTRHQTQEWYRRRVICDQEPSPIEQVHRVEYRPPWYVSFVYSDIGQAAYQEHEP